MSHPLDDTDYWRGQLRALATALCRRFAARQDQGPLVDDLEAEGWIVLCEHGPDHPHLRAKLRQALLDALARWLWGVTWDQAPRHLTCQVPLEDAAEALEIADQTPSVEDRLLAKDEIERIWGLTQARQHRAMRLLAHADSQRLDPEVYQAEGFTPHTLHDDRIRLREAGRRVRGA